MPISDTIWADIPRGNMLGLPASKHTQKEARLHAQNVDQAISNGTAEHEGGSELELATTLGRL